MKTTVNSLKRHTEIVQVLLLVGCWLGILFFVGCLPDQLEILDSWNVPCDSGTNQIWDSNPDYFVMGLSESVIALFKESVDPNSFNVNTGIVSNPSISFNASFTQTSQANDTLVLSPVSSYSAGQVYEVTMVVGAVTPADPESITSLRSASTIKFLAADKATDTVHPYISSLTPPDNATNVPLSQTLTITFSEPMMSVQVIRMDGYPDIAGDVQLGTTDMITYTAVPASGLSPNTTYAFVFVAADVGCSMGTTDFTGNQLVSMAGATNPSSVVWMFSTGAQ